MNDEIINLKKLGVISEVKYGENKHDIFKKTMKEKHIRNKRNKKLQYFKKHNRKSSNFKNNFYC